MGWRLASFDHIWNFSHTWIIRLGGRKPIRFVPICILFFQPIDQTISTRRGSQSETDIYYFCLGYSIAADGQVAVCILIYKEIAFNSTLIDMKLHILSFLKTDGHSSEKLMFQFPTARWHFSHECFIQLTLRNLHH